ncbi:MAG: hypothetical protein EPN88_00130 [Bacteroidetes bacterium]|nr:MAG: hypothetical protein EPN88_00130 [Bacteroidota bacterium]
MSIYNNIFLQTDKDGNKINPNILFLSGPLIQVVITPPQPLVDLLTKQGKAIPQPITGIGLIDTGATKTCVHEKIMEKLGVNPVGITTTHTANGPKGCNLYPAHFSFPGAKIEVDFNSVIEVNLTGQTFNNQQIISLIGRDMLSHTVFIYNGPLGMYTLTM